MIEKSRLAFLVGMPRAATTFLYHNLNLHPDLFIPFRRKTNFFSLHYGMGEHWFFSHFKDAPETAVALDTETLAFINRDLDSPQRIKTFNKDAKVILCIRDPASWAVSLYDQISTFDSNIPNFEAFLAGNYTLVEDGVGTIFHMRNGDISARVREYHALFPNSILILQFRDVIELPLESLKRIEQFLGVSSYFNAMNIITRKINSSGRKHNKFLNKVLRNEYVIASIRVLLPRKLVLAIRWIFDGLLSAGDDTVCDAPKTVEKLKMLSLANQYYKSDIDELEMYFKMPVK